MTTEERLENLERELARAKRRNRRLVAVVGFVVVGLILIWTLTKSTPAIQTQEAAKGPKPAQVIRATAFVLVDDKGRERGKLEMLKNGPGLALYDEKGQARAWLRLEKFESLGGSYDWATLSLFDEKGKERVNLCVNKGGSGLDLSDKNGVYRAGLSAGVDYAVLQLHDDDVRYGGHATRLRARLAVFKDGPLLEMFDENGNIRARLHETPGGASLHLCDEKDEYRALLGSFRLNGGKGGASLSLVDVNKKAVAMLNLSSPYGMWLDLSDEDAGRAMLAVTKDGPGLDLYDENGQAIWRAP